MNTNTLKLSMFLLSVAWAQAAPWTLSSGTSIGATALVLDRTAVPMIPRAMIVVDPFTVNAEVRKVSTVSTNNLTLSIALAKAHSAGAQVSFVSTDFVNAVVYGAVGDNSTDDTAALQAALDDQWVEGSGALWINGQNKTHRISTPLIMSSVCKINCTHFKAEAGFTPVDSTNAMLMASQGAVVAFTAATSDVITTASNHGIPSDDIKVMFKNVTGMTGVTAGRIYYARDRTANTFKVAATAGGAAVDITATGSGTAYCEINSASRIYLRDVYVDGSNVTDITGMDVFLQQPADVWKLRIDNCPGTGLKLGGQDGVFNNVMLINDGVGLAMTTASFFKFYQFNTEQCGKGVTMTSTNSSNLFDGVHMEMNASSGLSTATSIGFEVAAAADLVIRSLHMSMTDATQTIFKSTGAATVVSYSLSNWRFPSGTVEIVVIDDAARGISKTAWSDFRDNMTGPFIAPLSPSSDSYPDHAQFSVFGKSGRFVKFGTVDKDQPAFSIRADSDQVGDLAEFRNGSDAVKSSVQATGALATSVNAAPADGDLAAGEIAWWFDSTNGAARLKFKGKQADGTVKTWTIVPD